MQYPDNRLHPSNREQKIQKERHAWDARTMGKTHATIANELRMERSSVTRMLARLSKEAAKNLLDDIIAEKVRQITVLNHIIEEAMRAWEASKEPAKVVTREQFLLKAKENNEISSPIDSSLVTRVMDSDGSTQYLDIAIRAMAEIRKIMGMEMLEPEDQGSITFVITERIQDPDPLLESRTIDIIDVENSPGSLPDSI